MTHRTPSAAAEPHAEGPHIRQEPDSFPARVVLASALVVLILAGGGVVWAVAIMDIGMPPAPSATPGLGMPAVAGVRQTIIGVDTSAEVLSRQQRAALEMRGWADSTRGVERIPIEEAMRRVAEGGR
jgi:hypothetical protein